MRERVLCGGWFVAAVLVSMCLGCSNGFEGLAPANGAQPKLPPAELQGVIFEGYRGEQRELFVTSEKATVDLVARVAALESVALRFSETEHGGVEVSAPTGELKLDEDDFLLSGGVVGSAQAGERFSTESVRYVASSRELVSSTPVELRRTNLVLRADGMKLGLDARRLRLLGGVQARVVPQ